MKRLRGAVVLIGDGKVALVRRVNVQGTYYVFPGGGVEAGETVRDAAIREAHEELGMTVRLGDLLCIVHFVDEQHYFAAHAVAGDFGTRNGAEFSADAEAGSYEPVWLSCADLTQYDVYPVRLAELISLNALGAAVTPVIVEEVRR